MASWWRRRRAEPTGRRFDGRSGRPTSANGASSFHLWWEVPAVAPVVAAEATLLVVSPPVVPALHFWAMQASFVDGSGRAGGGGHLGLQWYPAHPGSTAVNWGGYGPDGRELAGSPSALPSATGNPNTRDLPWRAGVPHRLRIEVVAPGRFAGFVGIDGAAPVLVRELHAPGDRLTSLVVWSEVFADCDAPASVVRWSDLAVVTADGRRHPATGVRVSYQAVGDGGCVTTDVRVAAGAVEQVTGTERTTPAGARLALAPPDAAV